MVILILLYSEILQNHINDENTYFDSLRLIIGAAHCRFFTNLYINISMGQIEEEKTTLVLFQTKF